MTTYTCRVSDGGLDIDDTGAQTLVTGPEKAAQDAIDSLLMPFDTDRNYGNEMFNANGSLVSVVGNPLLGQQAVTSYLEGAIFRLMQLQQTSGLPIDDDERIKHIGSLIVRPGGDATEFQFFLALELVTETVIRAFRVRLSHLGIPVEGTVGGLAP
jgi:hypothetical protein